jgi:D-sedoheptulose 7-phosphate isomerase
MIRALAAVPLSSIESYAELVVATWTRAGEVVVIGNGGSAATAGHHAADLHHATAGGPHPPLRVMAPADHTALSTALANDHGYDKLFVRAVEAWLTPRSLLVAISASGRSENVLAACRLARDRNCPVIGLTGFDGGPLRSLSTLAIHVPVYDYGVVEVAHAGVCHLVRAAVECCARERQNG